MKQRNLKIETDYEAIREHIRRAQIGRAVVVSEVLANVIVAFTSGVKRFFANASSANNPALPAR